MNTMRTAMLLAFMTALFMGVGFLIGGRGGMMIAFVIAAGMNFFSYWNSDKMVLRAYRAQEVDERTAPEFYVMVRDLARNAGLPMPKVYVFDNPQRLSPEEVAGVMAHELAHIENRDTLTMTITATLAGAISMLSNFAFLFSSGRSDRNNPLGIVGVLIAMIVAPLAAMLVQMAISRTREYAADRRGAEICGQPRWLASALQKIAGDASHIENVDAERNPATAHMFIINPLNGQRMDNLFSTHPNTRNRIEALLAMSDIRPGGSTPPEAPVKASRTARSVPTTGWGRGKAEPPKGPWS